MATPSSSLIGGWGSVDSDGLTEPVRPHQSRLPFAARLFGVHHQSGATAQWKRDQDSTGWTAGMQRAD